MTPEEPKVALIVDDRVHIDEKKLAQGGKFIRIPPPPKPGTLTALWARLRVTYYAWKQHFTRHLPSRQRRVYITPVGDIVIYSWRSVSSREAHTALIAAQNAERALLAGELGKWS
jgi:hypothetical protein